jgi:hypothetical protein
LEQPNSLIQILQIKNKSLLNAKWRINKSKPQIERTIYIWQTH